MQDGVRPTQEQLLGTCFREVIARSDKLLIRIFLFFFPFFPLNSDTVRAALRGNPTESEWLDAFLHLN